MTGLERAWMRIRRPDGMVAVLAWSVLLLTALFGLSSASAQGDVLLVVQGTDGEGLNVRAEPDRLSPVLAAAGEGDNLTATGPELSSGGRSWRPIRTSDGVSGWVAAEFLAPVGPAIAVSTASPTVPVASPIASTPRPTVTPRPTATPEPGPPLELDVRFKFPELRDRVDQTITIDVFRGPVPQPGIEVRFTVEDEDPEVERIASVTDEDGRSTYTWNTRRYRGTTVVKVYAVGPDGGEGHAKASFFVR